jgi:SHS2 domain-containing protein
MNSEEGRIHAQCTKHTKRRGPSAENQRQIDHAIAARSLKISAYSGASVSINVSDHDTCARRDEPGTAPPNAQYEYLNHPADILLHAWGGDFISSLRNLAYAMFGCITSLSSVSTDAHHSEEFGQNITAQGHDTRSLVYAFLDEWLFNFHETGFIPNNIEIIEYDPHTHRISCKGNGEVLDLSRHPRGMEVKAITYSAMRVEEVNGRCDVYVVVDI